MTASIVTPDVGTQNVTANIVGGTNYNDLSLPATLTIMKADITGIVFTGNSFVYDGKAKSLVIAGKLPAGTSVTYIANSRTNAGRQIITANVNGGNNYKDLALTAELTITRAEFSGLVFNNKTGTYNRKSYQLELLGAPSGSEITYTVNNQIDADTYTVTAKVSHL